MNKPRLTTCQQPRSYVGGERCPELLGVKGAKAAIQVNCQIMGLNPILQLKLDCSRRREADRIPGVAVKCVDIRKNTSGEGGLLAAN